MTKLSHVIMTWTAFFLIVLSLSGCNTDSDYFKTDVSAQNSKKDLRILTIGTADSGGTMYPVGSAIADVISSGNETFKMNISASNGSITNIKELSDGQIDLGLVSGDAAFSAYYGTEEFSNAPVKNLRAVAAVYSSSSNWMALSKSGLIFVHDLEGKQIACGPQDSTTELSARIALNAIGLDDSNTVLKHYGLGSGALAVREGRLDAVHGFAGTPVNGLSELSEQVPARLLKYTDEELEKIISQNSYYYATVIPAGTYAGQTEDVKSFGVKCLICVNEDMDESLVYQLTKILDESREDLSKMHPTLSALIDRNFMFQKLPIPLHEGALRYYNES